MKILKSLALLAALLALGAIAWHFIRLPGKAEGADTDEITAVATVKTTSLARKTITATSTAFGSVVAQAGKVQTVSAAFETRVQHILVAPGQPVRKGDALLEFTPSPAAQLTLSQSQSAFEEADKERKQTQQRFDLKLATNADMNQATKAARDAEIQLRSLQQEGIADGNIRAEADGIVATVTAQDGQIVAAGATLLEIVNASEIEAKLGIEPSDISTIAPRQSVRLFPVNQPVKQPIIGSVRLVTQKIDSATRLVDVYVTLPGASGLLLGGYLRAEIDEVHRDALVAPRAAVLPSDGAWQVFTVRDGRAVRHAVKAGILTDQEVEILESDLQPGDSVVTVGNYELEDGMAVEEEK